MLLLLRDTEKSLDFIYCLCVWEQNDVIQTKIIGSQSIWIDNNNRESYAKKSEHMSERKEHVHPVDEGGIEKSGWFPMKTRKIRGIKYVKNRFKYNAP